MIRQAHSYLVGALSGVTLIGIAIAVFVVIVSAQVFHEWPIAATGETTGKATLAPAKALPAVDRSVPANGATATTTPPKPKRRTGGGPATNPPPATHHQAPPAPGHDATAPAEIVESDPAPPVVGTGKEPSSSGGHTGSHASKPSSPAKSKTQSPGLDSATSETSGASHQGGNGSAGPGGSEGAAGGSTGSPPPAAPPEETAEPTTGGGEEGTTTPVPTGSKKPSEALEETVDETVNGVNEALGGALEETGVKHITEEVVKGVAGPESVVGKTVDGAGEAGEGLLGAGR